MSAPYTINQLLTIIYNDLVEFMATQHGVVSIARDPLNVFEQIAGTGANEYRLILHWAGDQGFGNNLLQPLIGHRFELIVASNLGLTAQRDSALMSPTGERPALLDLIESTRLRVLELKFPKIVTREYIEYQGCDPVVTPEGYPLASYRLRFKLDAAMQPITRRNVT